MTLIIGRDSSMTSVEGQKFVVWLEKEMDQRRWGMTDLARASGLHYGTIANILNLKRNPGTKSCRAIAQALDLPEAFVLEKAGHMTTPPNPAENEFWQLRQLLRQMTREQRRDVIRYALDTFRQPDTEQELARLLQQLSEKLSGDTAGHSTETE